MEHQNEQPATPEPATPEPTTPEPTAPEPAAVKPEIATEPTNNYPPPPGATPQGQWGYTNQPPQNSSDEQTMSYLAVLGMLLLGFLAPLIVFLIAGNDPAKQYSKDQARQALNFSIMLVIAWIAAFVLSFVLIGFILMPLIVIWNIWGIVVGTMAVANKQPAPKYPLTYEFIK